MDKIFRSVNERLWREVKAQAVLEGKGLKEWVEGVVAAWLDRQDDIKVDKTKFIENYLESETKTKIIRNVNIMLWRRAQAQAALQGLSMKEWAESVLASAITKQSNASSGNLTDGVQVTATDQCDGRNELDSD